MKAWINRLALLAAVLCASPALAGPITAGTWSVMPAATNSGSPFFNNVSWDCDQCGIAWTTQGTEYLHAPGAPAAPVSFTVPGWAGGLGLGGTSDYLASHQFGYDSMTGEFLLDNGHGYTARSSEAGNVLLLRLVTLEAVTYWLWFEDLPQSGTDNDFQDRGYTWREPVAAGIVPEPATLLLIGLGVGTLSLRLRPWSKNAP